MAGSLSERILKLMRDLDYQINTPEVTTFGACHSCPGSARGAQTCVKCLTRELGYIIGSKKATEYTLAQQHARNLRRELLQQAINEN